MAEYQTGYDDERFEDSVSQTLENWKKQTEKWAIAPASCSNEGIELEMNKCHIYNVLRQDMNEVKAKLAAIEARLEIIEENLGNMDAKVELLQNECKRQEESNCQLEAGNVEIKTETTRQLHRIAQQKKNQVAQQKLYQAEERKKKGMAESVQTKKEWKIVLAGGHCRGRNFYSVDMLNLSSGKWTRLPSMEKCRFAPSSVLYNNEMIVVEGSGDDVPIQLMEKLSLNVVEDHSIAWERFPAQLPEDFYVQGSVIHNNRLILIGYYDQREAPTFSGIIQSLFKPKRKAPPSIVEMSLFPPYTTELLANMRETRHEYSVVLLGDKIVILGGRSHLGLFNALNSILTYDVTKNKCTELAPLPYAVTNMATVKCDNHSIMIIGGQDQEEKPSNKVLLYQVQTQQYQWLPSMKCKRAGCVAAVVEGTVIVMGGYDGQNHLKSVESFRFDRYTWEDFSDMLEARENATAVAF